MVVDSHDKSDPSLHRQELDRESSSIDTTENDMRMCPTEGRQKDFAAERIVPPDGKRNLQLENKDDSTNSIFDNYGDAEAEKFNKMIFRQQLNEVYLLVDFISGRADKNLNAIASKISDPENEGKKLDTYGVIKYVAKLRFPPSNQQSERAKDAAFLISVKNELNAIAYPARGQTIAYTTMFTRENDGGSTSRQEAAEAAFPNLKNGAKRFRRVKNMLSWSGLIITILSALLLWQATYGMQLAVRFDEAKKNDSLSASKVYDQIERERKSDASLHNDLNVSCRLPKYDRRTQTVDASQTLPDSDPPDRRSAPLQQLCGEYAYRHALLCVAIADIGSYSQSPMFKFTQILLPIHKLQSPGTCIDVKNDNPEILGRQEDAQSVASVLAMLSNYLLPILFGLAGTTASLVRGIQDKVNESVLSPRDSTLTLIRLPLGMVAGVCVGLFLNSTTATTQMNGSIGVFTLSASGIAFLAGYGAEGFFRSLDTLITRLFTPQNDGKVNAPRASAS